MALLDSNDYPSILLAISSVLDSDFVPPTKIEDQSILPIAEDWVAKETAGLTLSEADAIHAKLACINFAAYLLAPSVQSALTAAHAVHVGQGSGNVPNAQKISDECLKRAQREIGMIKGTADVPEPEEAPTSYAVLVETY